MSQSNTLTVQILDKEYCINCPDDERANLKAPPVTWTARCARSAPAAKSSAPTGLP